MGVNSAISPIFAPMQSFFSIKMRHVLGALMVLAAAAISNVLAFVPFPHPGSQGQCPAAALSLDSGGVHEFYVGLTDMVYNADTRTYEVTIKVFTDDLELGLEGASGQPVALDQQDLSKVHDAAISGYVSAHFSVKSKGGSSISFDFVGRETELDVTWIYLESAPMQPLQSAIVSNTMMMEIYKDQTHIVHITQGGRTRSALLHQNRKSDTVSL